jgi:hypothetical protein
LSWIKLTTRTVATAIALAATGAAVAGTIVIRAEGPSKGAYPPGKSLGPRVTLARGDTIVILDARGTRTLTGPGTIELAAASGGAAPSALASLIRNSGARQVRTGAVRGGFNAPTSSPNLWYVDTTRGGTICLPDLSRATLWRKSMAGPVTMTLTRAGASGATPVEFASGQNVRSWPVAALALAERTDYKLALAGSPPVTMRFVAIGTPGDSPDTLASTLIEKGCTTQLDLLVAAAGAPKTG